jgi:hypothetical protein
MSNQNVSKTILEYEVDRASVGKAVKANDTVEDSISDITKAVNRLNDADLPWKQQAKEIRDVNEEAKDLNTTLEKTGKNLKDVGDVRGGEGPDLGMAASRTAQTRGALEAFGVGGASGMLELVEGVADLGEVAQGAKGGVGGLLKNIGPLGVTAGIAAATIAFAAKTLLDAQREATEATKGIISANQRAFDAIVQGSEAVDSLRQSEETNIEARKLERDVLERLIAKGQQHVENLSAQEKALLGIGDVLGESPIEALENRLDETNNSIDESNKTLETLDENMDKVSTSASSLSDAATTAGDAIRFQQEAEIRGIEATKARIQAIQNETEIIKATIAELQGSTNPQDIAQVEALNNQLQRLGAESEVATRALSDGTAARVDANEELKKSEIQTAQTTETSAQKIDAANQKYADSVESASNAAANAASDAKMKAKDNAKDLATTLSDDLFESLIEQAQEQTNILRDSQRDDIQAVKDANRELKSIRRDGLRSERDAARERNFLALAQARENTRDTLKEEAIAEKERREDRQTALDNELSDLRLNSDLARQERLRDFNRANRDLKIDLNRSLRDISTNRSRQLQIASDALNKELALAAEGANKKLEIEAEYVKASTNMIQQLLDQVNGGGSGTSSLLTGGGSSISSLINAGIFD